MMTQESSEVLEKHAGSGSHARGNSEYVRLVIPDETRAVESEILLPRAESRLQSFWWWTKSSLWCVVIVLLAFILIRWGVPLFFKKVFALTFTTILVLQFHFLFRMNWY